MNLTIPDWWKYPKKVSMIPFSQFQNNLSDPVKKEFLVGYDMYDMTTFMYYKLGSIITWLYNYRNRNYVLVLILAFLTCIRCRFLSIYTNQVILNELTIGISTYIDRQIK